MFGQKHNIDKKKKLNFLVEILSDTKFLTDFTKTLLAFNGPLLDNLCSYRYCGLPLFYVILIQSFSPNGAQQINRF